MFFKFALLATTALFAWKVESRPCDQDLTVQAIGGLIHGTVNNATPDVREFLTIPYAQPPVNELRFAPPQPALPFGELDAKELGPSCMQYASNIPSILTHEVLELNLGGLNGTTPPVSEDCLTLSIWAPRGTAKKDLPVLIFFYGGAFTNGGVDTPYLMPSQWVQRTQSHIVVSFNHRDNVFGFPNAAGLPLEEQNVGLLDQRLAVEWVRDNIAAFGGDPARIGLWGQSSGAVTIGYYTYTYKDDPIANSVIMGSSNEFVDILSRDAPHSNFTYLASQFDCGNLSPSEELDCMRQVDAQAMVDFLGAYSDSGTLPLLIFSPVIDNYTVLENYTALAQPGEIAKIPALIGSTAQDGLAFVPYSPDGVDPEAADLMTILFFFCPTYTAAKNRIAALIGPVYRYVYAGNFPNVSPKEWMGAYHGADLPLLFGTHPFYRGDSTQLEYATSHAMQDAWLAFVATSGQNPSIKGWEAWDEVDGGRVVEFGNGVPARFIDTTEMEASCSSL